MSCSIFSLHRSNSMPSCAPQVRVDDNNKKGTAMAETNRDADPIVIKKYANRRLYNTATSSYVTLDHLAQMVRDGVDFQVFDAKSGEDITRSVLTHIIVEEENKGENMLPLGFLRQLISLYGDSVQAMVPGYLEQSMQAFSANQDQIRDMMEQAFANAANGNPMKAFEDMTRQNMQMFEQAMKSFNPFAAMDAAKASDGDSADVDAMRDQLNKLQKQLDEMSKKD